MSKNKLVNRIFTYSGFKVSEMSASNCANVFQRFHEILPLRLDFLSKILIRPELFVWNAKQERKFKGYFKQSYQKYSVSLLL